MPTRQRRQRRAEPVSITVDYRSQETVAWDDRLSALTDEMRLCRGRRRHNWKFNGDTVTVSRRDKYNTEIILEFRRRYRCDEGCLTTGSILMNAITWEPVSKFQYDHDPRYKIAGEPVNPAALRREVMIRENPRLFHYLLNDKVKVA